LRFSPRFAKITSPNSMCLLDPINYILRDHGSGDIYSIEPKLMDSLYINFDRIYRIIR